MMGTEFIEEHEKTDRNIFHSIASLKETAVDSLKEWIEQNPDAAFQYVRDNSAIRKLLSTQLDPLFLADFLALVNSPLPVKMLVAMDGWGYSLHLLSDLVAGSSADERLALLNDPALIRVFRSELSHSELLELLEVLEVPLRVRLQHVITNWGGDGDLIALIVNAAINAEVTELVTNTAFMNSLKGLLPPVLLNAVCDKLVESIENTVALQALFHLRYGIHLDSNGLEKAVEWLEGDETQETPWGTEGIRRLYNSFKRIPESHRNQVTHLMCYGNDQSPSGFASITSETPFIGISYDEEGTQNLENGGFTDEADGMRGLNLLDSVVIHELGHRVDCGQRYSLRPSFLALAGWKRHLLPGNERSVVDTMIQEMSNPLPGGLTPAEQSLAKRAAAIAISNGCDNLAQIKDHLMAAFKEEGLRARGSRSQRVRSLDDLFSEFEACNLAWHVQEGHSSNSPWMSEPYDGYLPNVQFHDAYGDNEWWQYDNEARQDKLSRYAFRDPGEYFAELYATYYLTDPYGDKVPEPLKEWFERNVARNA